METTLFALVIALSAAVLALLGKVWLMRKTAREIEAALAERLTTDTNTLISISSGDGAMRSLAAALNVQLRALRAKRHRYEQGDAELKTAVTNIAHDLRTPLTAICAYLDLLKREEQTEAAARYAAVIRSRADAMRALTEELFLYSRILDGERRDAAQAVDLRSAIEENAAAFYAALMERGIEPVIFLPETKVVRTLDPAALSRVLSNLMSNALKYSGGDLDIRLSEDGEIRFSNSAPDLSEVEVGRLFDRFYTVEAARKSTGLGLSIAKALAQRMGGTIDADYKGGRLTIRLQFPA